MSSKKIITVFGATGKQGGAIVEKFMSDPVLKNEWAVRGVTRDVSKDSAKKLTSQGVEVVSGDLNNKESLVTAVAGSHTVFAVTNYWETMSKDVEIQQGKNIADAVKEAGVQHFIWSSLIDVTKVTKGRLSKVYHFDSKAEIEDYVRSLDIPATFFLAGWYMSNFEGPAWFRKTPPENAWTFAIPSVSTALVPTYDADDTGKYIKAIVLNRDSLLGQRVLGANEYKTFDELLADFRRVFPREGGNARYYQMPDEEYRAGMKSAGTPDFVADELLENIQLLSQEGYYGGESLEATRKLIEGIDEKLTTWAEWLLESKTFKQLE